jgi:ADP-ribose pyrophosphatase YjhB (NUDIX family)
MSFIESAVAAVIQDPAGRVLMCQQSQGHRLWGLPGGTINRGESPLRAVVRDVHQLTGDGCGEDLPDVLVYVFRANLNGEATLNAPGRIRRLAWQDPEDLPRPVTATTVTALGDMAAGRSGVLRVVERYAEPEVPDATESAPALSTAAAAVA